MNDRQDFRGLERIRPAWRTEWRSGCRTLDDEHRSLIEDFATLIGRIGDGEPDLAVAPALAAIVEGCRRHFAREEALLRGIAYPGCEAHALLHADLVNRFQALHARHPTDWEMLASRLFDMLVLHLSIEDRKFFAWLPQPR